MRQAQVTGRGKRQTTTDNLGMWYGGILIHLAGGRSDTAMGQSSAATGFPGAACSARCVQNAGHRTGCITRESGYLR